MLTAASTLVQNEAPVEVPLPVDPTLTLKLGVLSLLFGYVKVAVKQGSIYVKVAVVAAMKPPLL